MQKNAADRGNVYIVDDDAGAEINSPMAFQAPKANTGL